MEVLTGTSTINGGFSIAMFDYCSKWRVTWVTCVSINKVMHIHQFVSGFKSRGGGIVVIVKDRKRWFWVRVAQVESPQNLGLISTKKYFPLQWPEMSRKHGNPLVIKHGVLEKFPKKNLDDVPNKPSIFIGDFPAINLHLVRGFPM